MTAMWQAFDLPQSLFLALAALAGLAVGGWLTLLTHRLPRMMEREWQAHCQESAEPAAATEPACAPVYGLRAPVSHCPQCSAPVRGWRLLPLAGWLLLGCCAIRGAAIGWRYPAIELLTAVLFAACAWRFGPTPIALCGMGLSASLVALAWIDLESTLLPDAITLPLAWAGLLVNLGDGFTPLPLAVLGAVAGYGFLWLIFHAFRYFTGREGMGYGDFAAGRAGRMVRGGRAAHAAAGGVAGRRAGGRYDDAGRPSPPWPTLAFRPLPGVGRGGGAVAGRRARAGKAVAMTIEHGAGARAAIHGTKR